MKNITKINEVNWTKDDVKNSIDEFLKFYEQRPIKDNHGGCLSVNMFDAWFIFKQINPKYVIESGVFQGQGTWMIEQLLPATKIVSIDPLPQQLRYRSNNAKYTTQDFLTFTNENISRERAKETMIYFDDHQDQYTRLLHAYKLGFKHLLFDDNHPEFRGMRHLTLAACLNGKSDPGYNIPPTAKEDLLNVIDTYYICPPVFRWNEPVSMEKSMIEEEPLFNDYDERYNVLYEDMHNYRWTTYVKLKD